MNINQRHKSRPESHILLVVWQFVAAFFWLVGVGAAAVFAFPFSPGYEGSSVEIGDIFGMIAGTMFLLGCLGVSLASGVGLLHKKSWAQVVSIVSSALSIFLVPIGTVAGILALIYLLKSRTRDYLNGNP
jgi:hypothetical protein